MPTLRKIKRAASRPTSQRFCSTFNFTQPHPKPTQQPTCGHVDMWTMENLSATFNNNSFIKIIFTNDIIEIEIEE